MRNNEITMKLLITGLVYKIWITFHAGSFSWIRYTKCSGVWVFTQRVIPNSGAERIGFIRSRVKKTPIRYETESDTLVIRYHVNGSQSFLAVATKRKSEMTSYLNNGDDVINYFAKLEKFLPHSIIIPSFMAVRSHMPELD